MRGRDQAHPAAGLGDGPQRGGQLLARGLGGLVDLGTDLLQAREPRRLVAAQVGPRRLLGAKHRELLLHLRVHVLLCWAVYDRLKDSFGDVLGRVG